MANSEWKNILKQHLVNIYGNDVANDIYEKFINFIEPSVVKKSKNKSLWSSSDIALITYGDSIKEEGELPLQTLNKFADKYLSSFINTIHILPFFPYSSDDGFSVIDFEQVNTNLGRWADIENIAKKFNLMVDLVINHVSSKSRWFSNYLKQEGEGADFFIEVNPNTDLSQVVRPRSLPLLTAFETKNGKKYIWTTFSADQIDLNFENPKVLLKFLQILNTYIKHGAKIIRLDAIAFLWKEIGTSCLHLPQTHEIVKLLRFFTDITAPGTIILTETNVPNQENLSYFGSGDEAHMVYQFSLPPLLLHALYSGNGTYLTQWAKELPELEPDRTFFNFTSSHDGIGVRPLEGLLPDDEKSALFESIEKAGGLISMKKNSDGTESPYELNITYFDALKLIASGEDGLQEKRFLCSQAIMLTMKGIPAFYIHSLLASHNYYEGVKLTGRARTINREKLDYRSLQKELNGNGVRNRVFTKIKTLVELRIKNTAFSPSAKQEILDLGKNVFAYKRKSGKGDYIIVINNLTSSTISVNIKEHGNIFKDIITESVFYEQINLSDYQFVWLIKTTL